jgi:hypothetical protein
MDWRTTGVNNLLLTPYYPFVSVRPLGFVWPGVDGLGPMPAVPSVEGTWLRN